MGLSAAIVGVRVSVFVVVLVWCLWWCWCGWGCGGLVVGLCFVGYCSLGCIRDGLEDSLRSWGARVETMGGWLVVSSWMAQYTVMHY